MKKYIVLMLSLLSIVAFASEPVCTQQTDAAESTGQLEIKTDVPNYLKGATITVTLADGSSSTVPAEKFKVVARRQQFITTHTESKTVVSCTTNTPNKNRVSLLGGHGAQEGVTRAATSPTSATVESNVGLVGGAQYQRMLNDRFSLGVQGQTNKTGSILIGVDF